MLHEDPNSKSRSADIRAARAQVEAAQRRRSRVIKATGEGGLPKIPRYTILNELHRGGQGVVYLGVQESTDRRVAIKILNRGPLSGSGAALARFEREVEALSLLKHPNVVTIHDCGRDHEQVYLVMDYVDGAALDAYVKGASLPLRGIIELLAKICDGVNAAHLRGVIHRDLKPGNILVDGRGEPHVVDFGLAKLAETGPTPPAMTETGQFVGSLPWSSPEQAEAQALDVRTDVYSLGVVAYQLCTRVFPYPVSGSVAEVARNIAGREPTPPSSVKPEIDRELETILLKCLAKDPDRRYQSAGELARDLRRYLASEPIEARRDSIAYILSKQLARYRVIAIATVTVLLVLVVALAVSVTLWRRAVRQESLAKMNAIAAHEAATRADSEAEQARAVVEFMRGVLTSVEPESGGADVKLIEVLAKASSTAAQQFGAHPLQEAEVRDLLGQIYHKLAMWEDAKAQFKRAADLLTQEIGADDPRTIATRLRQVQAVICLSQTIEAAFILEDLTPRVRRVIAADDPLSIETDRSNAIILLFRGKVDEAEAEFVRLRQLPGLANDDASQVRILSALTAAYTSRLGIEDMVERRAIAARGEPLALEWIERSTRLVGPRASITFQARVKWADFVSNLGRYRESAEVCRAVLDESDGVLGACHAIRINAMTTLAEALARQGGDVEPARLMATALECQRQGFTPDSPVYLGLVFDALRYLDRGGLGAEGERFAKEVVKSLKALGGGHDQMLPMAELWVASFTSMQGRHDEAEGLFRPVVDHFASDDDRNRARVHLQYGRHLVRRGELERADQELTAAKDCLGDIRRGTWDSHPDDLIVAFIELHRARGDSTKVAEFEALQRDSRGN